MEQTYLCPRCQGMMEFDGDEAYICPDCGLVGVVVDDEGYVEFNDEDLNYNEVYGEQKQCPKCGAYMIPTDDGWDCPECYHSI